MNEKIKLLFKNLKIYIEKYNLGFLLFLLIAGISPFVIEEFNLSTFRYYRAYYATVITLSFAIFSFIQQQKKLLEEKKKENEIKEKELEEKRDYYRPIFIVESNKVKLLMKNPDLYLENVRFFSDDFENQSIPIPENLKSGAIIKEIFTIPFFITGQTLIGENILFGYMNGKEKIYRYQKEEELSTYPEIKEGNYNLESFNKTWPYFNNYSNTINPSIESIFFEKTFIIRGMITKYNYYEIFYESLNTKTIQEFYNNIFKSLHKILVRYAVTINSLNEALQILLDKKKLINIEIDPQIWKNYMDTLDTDSYLGGYDFKNTNLLISLKSLDEIPKVDLFTIIDILKNNLPSSTQNIYTTDFNNVYFLLFLIMNFLCNYSNEFSVSIFNIESNDNIVDLKSCIIEKLVYRDIF